MKRLLFLVLFLFVSNICFADSIEKIVYDSLRNGYISRDGSRLTSAQCSEIASNVGEAVEKYSTEYDIDPVLIISFMYKESSFRPWIKCIEDYGILQLNSRYSAAHTCKMLGIELDIDKLYEIDYSVMLFCNYFKYLRRYLDLDDAIMAYNVGITRVRRLNRRGLVYRKGLDYLDKVKDAYQVFRRRYLNIHTRSTVSDSLPDEYYMDVEFLKRQIDVCIAQLGRLVDKLANVLSPDNLEYLKVEAITEELQKQVQKLEEIVEMKSGEEGGEHGDS